MARIEAKRVAWRCYEKPEICRVVAARSKYHPWLLERRGERRVPEIAFSNMAIVNAKAGGWRHACAHKMLARAAAPSSVIVILCAGEQRPRGEGKHLETAPLVAQ